MKTNIGGVSIRNDFFKKPYEGKIIPVFNLYLSLVNLSVIFDWVLLWWGITVESYTKARKDTKV